MLRNRAKLLLRRHHWILNEVLSLNAQEYSACWLHHMVNLWFLNEVLSLNAQEYGVVGWFRGLPGSSSMKS